MSIKGLSPIIKNKNGAVLICIGGESFKAIQVVFNITPVLVGLLFILFNKRLSVGTAALLSKMSGDESPDEQQSSRHLITSLGHC